MRTPGPCRSASRPMVVSAGLPGRPTLLGRRRSRRSPWPRGRAPTPSWPRSRTGREHNPLGPLDRPAQRGNRAVARRGGQDLRLREPEHAARHEHDRHHLLAGRPDALLCADRAPGDPRLGRDEQPDPRRDDCRSLRHARQLHSPRPRPDLALVGGAWPPYVGVTRTAADTPLQFTFGRETSSLSTSTPYLTIPYDTVVTVVWGNNVRSEQVTVTLNLRVVVKEQRDHRHSLTASHRGGPPVQRRVEDGFQRIGDRACFAVSPAERFTHRFEDVSTRLHRCRLPRGRRT